jgi:hypothetical protein
MHRPPHDDERVGLTGLFHRFLKAIRIFTTIAKFQSIDWDHFLADLEASLGIQQSIEARPRRDPQMVTALGTNRLVSFEVGSVKSRVARWALDP